MDRRTRVLQKLLKFTTERGYSPSLRELAVLVGVQSTSTVAYHLGMLGWSGFLTRGGPNEARTLRVTDAGKRWLASQGETT